MMYIGYESYKQGFIEALELGNGQILWEFTLDLCTQVNEVILYQSGSREKRSK